MADRKVKIEQANSVQVVSGDGATFISIHASTPEAVEAIQTALNEGKQLESIDAQGVFHNLPFPRNPSFTGREQILEQIEKNLKQKDAAAITQPQAIHGLGGIGKTQIAIEYAYRHLNEYRYIFWVEAESDASFSKSFSQIASILNLPQTSEKEKILLNKAVLSWFENHQDCLLIFDNAEDVKSLQPYLPLTESGQIIITTRAVAMAGVAKSVELNKMEPESAVEFLLKRASIANPDDVQVDNAKQICSLLDHLPLAIDHAGAYIEATRCKLSQYKDYLQQHGSKILEDKQYASANYNETVATTWNISIDKLNETNPAAVALLTASCYLAPDDIPINLFTDGQEYLPEPLKETAKDDYRLNQALGDLQKYSLIRRQQGGKTFSIHRLVQSVIHDLQNEAESTKWLNTMIGCLSACTPDAQDFRNWPLLGSLLSHAESLFAETDKLNLQTEPLSHLLNKFAYYLKNRADFAAAEPLYQRALKIDEKALGPDHPDVAIGLNNLAELYISQGRYGEAEPLHQRALKISEKALGPDHPDVSTRLNNLSLLYSSQGRYAEAEPLIQRALEMSEKALGPDHPDVAIRLNNLAELYIFQGRYGEAEPLHQRALKISEKTLGPDHLHVSIRLNNLAGLYNSQGRYAEAEPLHQRSLKISEKVLGPDHPDVAIRLNNLALLYNNQGRYDKAEPLSKQALKISEKLLGKDHPTVAIRLHNLALLYSKQGRYDEAESLIQRALKIFEHALGPNHPKTVTVLESMAVFYCEWGKEDKAAEYAKRAEKAKAKD